MNIIWNVFHAFHNRYGIIDYQLLSQTICQSIINLENIKLQIGDPPTTSSEFWDYVIE